MYAKNPLTYIISFLFIVFFTTNIFIVTEQHFILLAKSYVSGQLTIPPTNNNVSDLALYKDKYYWPLGPFPAVIIVPFVAVFERFLQGYISFPLSVLNFYLLYKIARKFELSHQKSLLLATFFIFGSVYTPLAALPASWYFAQVIACSFLIFAIYEFLNKRRYLLIGIFIALSAATRLNLLFSSLFFLYFLLKAPNKLANLLKFASPIVIVLVMIGIYNYSRFQNPLESGYNLQMIPQEASDRRSIGLFSIHHIPSNLFFMLLKGPEPVLNSAHELKPPFLTFDSYGLSLFFLSPVLFYLYKANYKKEIIAVSSVTILVLLIPIITYYGIGHRQVSFRYALDFFPFIYLLLLDSVKKVQIKKLYLLIFTGVFFSIYFSFIYLNGQQIN